MKKIILMRHGIAEEHSWCTLNQKADSDRPLVEEGRNKVRCISKSLAKIISSDCIVSSSPYVRAVETASILREELQSKITEPGYLEEMTPEYEPTETIKAANRFLDKYSCDELCLVGHQPNISAFCSLLVTGSTRISFSFGRSTAVILQSPSTLQAGSCVVLGMIRPKWSN